MHELLATALDLVGALLIVGALVALAWRFDPAAGLAVAGVGLIAVSWIGDRRDGRRAR